MTKSIRMWGRICATTLYLLALTHTAHAAPAVDKPNANNGPRWVPGEILVAPKPALPQQAFDRILKRAGGARGAKLHGLNVHIIRVAPQAVEAVTRALANNRHIEFAEPNHLVPPTFVANDTYYSNAWHLAKTNASAAWDVTEGAGITVAVLDTGVNSNHSDLAANMLPGRNTASGDSTTTDVFGHGTKVAGVIAAVTDNGTGVASLAGQAKVLPIRITNSSDGWASTSAIVAGITWAADNGARVANVSYDVAGQSSVSAAAAYMRNKGGVVVVAAGNTGTDRGYQPDDAVIHVSATTSGDSRASWSSYGQYVDVSAPGAGIWTTKSGGGYGTASGTSFASPATAGVVALIMAANPSLSPSQVEAILLSSSDDLGTAGWDSQYGHGRINALAAVTMAGQAAPDLERPTINFTFPYVGTVADGISPVTLNATDNAGVTRVELQVDGRNIGTDSQAPWDFSWDTSADRDGMVRLTATAYDSAGNSASTSRDVEISNGSGSDDTIAPVVAIVSPADGAEVSGSVTIAAMATDNVAVASVTLIANGQTKCTGTPSVSCKWNLRKMAAGSYNITAIARDSAGNEASSAITVVIPGSTETTTNPKKGGGKGKPGR